MAAIAGIHHKITGLKIEDWRKKILITETIQKKEVANDQQL
jgi:hypothetical protein